MTNIQYKKIEESLTQIRLSSYCGESDEKTLQNYLYNIKLCRAFYPLLNFFEVALRNAIDKALIEYNGNGDWFDTLPLDAKGMQKILDAKKKIKIQHHIITHDRIVAELSLGFWTSFFSKAFAQFSYQSVIIKNSFPNCPRKLRTIKNLQPRLERFRILRNRISHCERISHFSDLQKLHAELLETITWVEKEIANLAMQVDDVPQVLGVQK